MKINIHNESTQDFRNNVVVKLLFTLAKEISKEYGISEQNGRLYLLYDDAGREVFCQLLRDTYDLEIKTWCWGVNPETVVGTGFDVTENAELTKLILQYA